MHLNLRISLMMAAIALVPAALSGQAVDPSVAAFDPSVNVRVQDADRPDNPLLPGGSAAWTGQPVMSQTQTLSAGAGLKPGSATSATATRASQFPSLVGASAWGASAGGSSSLAVSVSQTATTTTPEHTQTASRWMKSATSRKLNLMTAAADVKSVKLAHSDDDFSSEDALSIEQKQLAEANQKLRKLKQSAERSKRSRLNNPFQAKADAATSAHWGADTSSARALAQQQHEAGMLLHSGFNARTTRKRKRAHGSSSSNANSRSF
jgi:hypothetical protein